MFFFDPLYLILALPALLLGLYAQYRTKSAFNKYAQVPTRRGLTGAQVARLLLDADGLTNVQIEPSQGGKLSDHYDPSSKILRLSPDVYQGDSLAAAGVAAHETGHALQDAAHYTPLVLRGAMVPSVRIGSWLGPLLFMAGWFIHLTQLSWAGVILFSAASVFAVVTLPVEFDASRRAKQLLIARNILGQDEMVGVNSVLNAAALTYVAAALQAIGTLLYYVLLLSGGRSRR